jgi:hypothetical protein
MKPTQNTGFDEVIHLIDAARQKAYQAVNTSLIELYWQVGAYISHKMASAEWGDGVVKDLAVYLAQTQPNLKGFTQRNLFRMRQFYETYRDNTIVSALLTQLPWTHNLNIARHPRALCRHPRDISRHPRDISRHPREGGEPAALARHPREGGEPAPQIPSSPSAFVGEPETSLDSRLRGNDGCESAGDLT